MPLIVRQNIENGVIGVWKIIEEIENLVTLARLSQQDVNTFSGISALHRKKEWLGTRALLNELLNEAQLIEYHIDGRPFLNNSPYNISISHSSGYVAVILHTHSIPGIDIELLTRQVGRVASRFLSPDELAACIAKPELSNHRFLVHWCAKEAIFKMVPLSNIEFATDINILPDDFDQESGTFKGIFNDKTGPVPIGLYYRITDELMIIWGWSDKANFHL